MLTNLWSTYSKQIAQKKAVLKVEDSQEADLLTRTYTHNRSKETDDNIESIRFCANGSYESRNCTRLDTILRRQT